MKPEWKWGDAREQAFRTLITWLTHPPALGYPDSGKPLLLRTDASKQGLGMVLCQEQESGDVRVIAYGSQTLWLPEKKITTLTNWSSEQCVGMQPNSFTTIFMVHLVLW